MGRDLSAQLAYAQLAEQHWPELLDLRWYGGFDPLGYSVLSPPVMALLGVRLTTALGYVLSVVLFAALLKRTGVAFRSTTAAGPNSYPTIPLSALGAADACERVRRVLASIVQAVKSA